jgi:putative ABC transport system permease protein
MDSVLADLRYAIRNIARRPGFAALAILTLAVGVGINAVAFTAVNGLLFHPFRFKDVDRLGWIMLATPGNPHGQLSYTEFGELRRHARAFDAVAAQGRQPLALTTDGRVEQVWALFVSGDYFRALDTRPAIGRAIDASDASREDLAALVSHEFWRTRLNGESIAGRTITIANRTVTVAGVLPEGSPGAHGLFTPDVWLSLERADAFGLPRRLLTNEDRWLGAIARLADGANAARADADLAAIGAQLPVPAGQEAASRRLAFFPMRDGHPEVQSLAPYVWIAMSVVGIVLLIACFNVAGLLLARATERQREIAIRTALGAGRLRIVRQLVTEGVLLAVLSGCAALLLASWSGTLLAYFSLPAPIPQRLEMPIGNRVVLFTMLMVLVAGVLPGLLPALQATRRNVVGSMRLGGGGGSRPSRLRSVFVVAQIAGSTLFLATALLFVRSFWNANRVDLGFNPDHMLVARMDPSLYGFEGDRAAWFAREVADRVSSLPGMTVAIADRVPFAVGYPPAAVVSTTTLGCIASSCRPTIYYAVGAHHFEAVGIPLRSGRDFTATELKTGGAIIVNEAMAAALWPGRSPLGEPVRLGDQGAGATVIGVAGDVGLGYTGQAASPMFYQPIRDTDFRRSGFTLVARTTGPDALAAAAIRDAVHAVAPSMPIASLTTMRELLDLPMWPRRTAAGFFVICGSLALLLATVGLFGVTYFAVRQRTREFGVRIALGARSSDVVRQVLREGMRLAAPGAALGLIAAAIAGRVLARALLGVSAVDPVSFTATAGLELLVALIACALPALRATQADPMIALRDDH